MIHEEVSGEGVVTLTLDRPRANTFDRGQTARLREAIARITTLETATCVVVRAEGRMFCGGADIAMLRDITAADAPGAAMAAFVAELQAAFAALEDLALPTVAAVHGAAMGGGLELALACDFRVVADDASLGLPEVRIGMVPGAGGTQRLPRLVGPALAMRMIAAGESVAGREALACGLAHQVVPAPDVQAAAAALATRLADLPSAAVAAAARCVRLGAANAAGGFEAEIDAVRELIGRPGTRELLEDFLAR